MIPYGRHDIDHDDIFAVVEALRSDFLTQGPRVPAFEEAFAAGCSARFAVAMNSATSALHAACHALGVKPGDRVWTSPNSFVASANCALYCGASADFVDIDPRTYNIGIEPLEAKLAAAEAKCALPKAIIAVHFAGQSSNMRAIHRLSRQYGFRIIEDASHAVGASYDGGPVGDCRYSDIAVFSFHPVKIVTTAEGGLATTNDEELAESMRRFRTHGVTRDERHMRGVSDGPWYYEQVELGYNYRMTDVLAALGLRQMDRLERFVAQRCEHAQAYDEAFAALPLIRPWQDHATRSSWHLYAIQVDEQASGRSRRQVFEGLRARGIGVNVHYIPIYSQPYYRDLGFPAHYCPEAEAYYRRAISIPLYAGLSDEDRAAVIAALAAELGL